MKLSKRLESIANFVAENSIVADIGTDHGYIPVYLIENNISKRVIGTDISSGSLNKIIELIKSEGLEDKIEARLGNGLDIIRPYEVDTLIVSGMGGILISEILEKNTKVTRSIDNYILQPMVGSTELRKYLMENNFEIIDEDLVLEDEKYYEVILARKGKQDVEKDIHYEISSILIEDKHPLLKSFLEYKIYKTYAIIQEVKEKETEKSKDKYIKLRQVLEVYEEVLREIES